MLDVGASADPNAKGEHGLTPLHWAITNVDRTIWRVRLLLDADADPNLKNKKGELPLDVARGKAKDVLFAYMLKQTRHPTQPRIASHRRPEGRSRRHRRTARRQRRPGRTHAALGGPRTTHPHGYPRPRRQRRRPEREGRARVHPPALGGLHRPPRLSRVDWPRRVAVFPAQRGDEPWPGGRGWLPTRGSHRSGLAQLRHPAPRTMVSLLNGTHCERLAPLGEDRFCVGARSGPMSCVPGDFADQAICATAVPFHIGIGAAPGSCR